MQDLRPGGPLYLREHIPAEEIFPWYKRLPAFEDVVFDQFKDRLKGHPVSYTHLTLPTICSV